MKDIEPSKMRILADQGLKVVVDAAETRPPLMEGQDAIGYALVVGAAVGAAHSLGMMKAEQFISAVKLLSQCKTIEEIDSVVGWSHLNREAEL